MREGRMRQVCVRDGLKGMERGEISRWEMERGKDGGSGEGEKEGRKADEERKGRERERRTGGGKGRRGRGGVKGKGNVNETRKEREEGGN